MAKTSKEKADIWFPLFIGDYLADTTRLTTEQHGAYLLLIMDYWRNGPPPDDDGVLAQITKASPKAWKQIRPVLSRYFEIQEGAWMHARIEGDIAEANESKEKAQAKAKKGAEARWGKQNHKKSTEEPPCIAGSNASCNAPSMPQALQEQCPSTSTSSSQTPGSADVDSTVGVDEEWWKGAPLPDEDEHQATSNPAVGMAVALRKLQVSVTAMHPTLLDWVGKGVALQTLTEAVALIRMRPGKESGPINPNYLATVLADVQSPKTAKGAAAAEVKGWWESWSGIQAKGLELVGQQREGELDPDYKIRVFHAAGDGPWWEKLRTGPTVQGFRTPMQAATA